MNSSAAILEDARKQAAREYLKRASEYASINEMARVENLNRRSLTRKLNKLRALVGDDEEPAPDFQIADLPDADLPVEDIISRMKAVSSQAIKANEARKLIPISIKIDGPYGIAHFGDPHIDNYACDWHQLETDVNTVRNTPGLFAGNVGDTHDNWVGRLSGLYAHNPNTRGEVKKLIEWLATSVPWIYWLAGNHDLWHGGGDILDFLKKSRGAAEPWRARLSLVSPNGKSVRVNAAHDHKGTSMWNEMHAQLRAVKVGAKDHIFVAGHRHTSGYMVSKCPSTGLLSHLLRVSGYKRVDDHAIVNGFEDARIRPSSMTIINPFYGDDDPRLVRVELDVQEGAEVLTWMRSRHERGRSSDAGPDSGGSRPVHSRRVRTGQRTLRPKTRARAS